MYLGRVSSIVNSARNELYREAFEFRDDFPYDVPLSKEVMAIKRSCLSHRLGSDLVHESFKSDNIQAPVVVKVNSDFFEFDTCFQPRILGELNAAMLQVIPMVVLKKCEQDTYFIPTPNSRNLMSVASSNHITMSYDSDIQMSILDTIRESAIENIEQRFDLYFNEDRRLDLFTSMAKPYVIFDETDQYDRCCLAVVFSIDLFEDEYNSSNLKAFTNEFKLEDLMDLKSRYLFESNKTIKMDSWSNHIVSKILIEH